MDTNNSSENLKGKVYLEDLEIDRRIELIY
jgi:hypothetical protein